MLASPTLTPRNSKATGLANTLVSRDACFEIVRGVGTIVSLRGAIMWVWETTATAYINRQKLVVFITWIALPSPLGEKFLRFVFEQCSMISCLNNCD